MNKKMKTIITVIENNKTLQRFTGQCSSCKEYFNHSLFENYCSIKCFEKGLKEKIDSYSFKNKVINNIKLVHVSINKDKTLGIGGIVK